MSWKCPNYLTAKVVPQKLTSAGLLRAQLALLSPKEYLNSVGESGGENPNRGGWQGLSPGPSLILHTDEEGDAGGFQEDTQLTSGRILQPQFFLDSEADWG